MRKFTLFILAVLMTLPMDAANITGGTKLYFKPNSNWKQANARFAAYFFGGGETWRDMTEVETGVYEVESPTGTYTKVIFCRMNPATTANNWDNKWNQTSDLTYDGTKNCYTLAEGSWDYGSGSWSIYTIPVVTEPISIYLEKESVANWSNVYYYAWTGSNNAITAWPGDIITTTEVVEGVEYYVHTYNDVASLNIIFNNNSGTQTHDITGINKTTYFRLKDKVDGKHNVAQLTPGGLDYNVTVPAGTNECYIAGAFNGWTFSKMTKVTDTHYTINILEATPETEYKYASGPDWAYEEVISGNRVWSENDVVSAWAQVYAPNVEPGDITFNVTVPEGTVICYMVGSFNNWDISNAYEMVPNGDGTFSLTLSNVTDVVYKYTTLYDPTTMLWEEHDNRSASIATSNEYNDVVSAWQFPTGVTTLEQSAGKVYGAKGVICLEGNFAKSMPIYNAQGILVKVIEATQGKQVINMPRGLYIVNNTKVLVY